MSIGLDVEAEGAGAAEGAGTAEGSGTAEGAAAAAGVFKEWISGSSPASASCTAFAFAAAV